jgi:hypothetical protein
MWRTATTHRNEATQSSRVRNATQQKITKDNTGRETTPSTSSRKYIRVHGAGKGSDTGMKLSFESVLVLAYIGKSNAQRTVA